MTGRTQAQLKRPELALEKENNLKLNGLQLISVKAKIKCSNKTRY